MAAMPRFEGEIPPAGAWVGLTAESSGPIVDSRRIAPTRRGTAMRNLAAAAMATLLVAASAAGSQAADLTRLRANHVYPGPEVVTDEGIVPACADPSVIGTVARRFSSTESSYWNSSAAIVNVSNPREIAYRPWGSDFVVRRFCVADAAVLDQTVPPVRDHAVYYVVVDDGGFAGVGWAVHWCVVGYDRAYAFAPGCKMMRP